MRHRTRLDRKEEKKRLCALTSAEMKDDTKWGWQLNVVFSLWTCVCGCLREWGGGMGGFIDGTRLSIISATVGKLSLQPFAQGPPTHTPANELPAGWLTALSSQWWRGRERRWGDKALSEPFCVWWLKSTVCLQACWDLQPFALPLPAFVFFRAVFFSHPPFLFLWLRRVLCARRTFSSPLWWYWLQSLPWLQPWSIDQPALLEANKHTCDTHKVCVSDYTLSSPTSKCSTRRV